MRRSISAELTRLRLERAKRRMVGTDAPMKDVALDAGFRNSDHFYKVFARVEGMSPSRGGYVQQGIGVVFRTTSGRHDGTWFAT